MTRPLRGNHVKPPFQKTAGNVSSVRKPAAVATLVLVLAGCGGDNSSESQALTAAAWRREVNAICRDIGGQVRAVRLPVKETQILPFTAEVIPLWKSEEERIRALSPPAELVDAAGQLADALAEVNLSLLEIHIATQRNDGVRRFYAVKRSDTAARGVKLRSRALGLRDCAKQRVP
jgi:hypothetical protein